MALAGVDSGSAGTTGLEASGAKSLYSEQCKALKRQNKEYTATPNMQAICTTFSYNKRITSKTWVLVMKALKWLIFWVIAGPILVFAGLAVFLSFADLNQYKSTLEEQGKALTGRTLTIDGDIEASVFPWIKLKTGAIELANAEGFGKQPMVTLTSASAGLKLMPLLTGAIEIDVVSVEGLVADLQVNAEGISNTDDLFSASTENSTSEEPAGSDTSVPQIKLGGVSILNSSFHYRDATSGVDFKASNVNFKVGALDGLSDTPIEANLDIFSRPDNLKAAIALRSDIKANLEEMRFHISNLDLKTDLRGESIPDGAITLVVGGDLEADLVAQTLNIPVLELLLGDTTLKGNANLSGLDQSMPQVAFDLAGDSLNLDQLLGLDSTVSTTETTSPQNGETDDAIALPLETLRTLNIEGLMTLQKLIVSNMELSDIALKLRTKDGLLEIPNLAAKIYEGSIDSNLSLDVRNEVPRYTLDGKISAVQAQPLLTAAADFKQLLGLGNIQFNINTAGDSVTKLTNALGGNFNFNFADGAIDGINLAAEGRKVMRLLGKDVGEDEGEEIRKTDFSVLGASAKITEGVVESTDLDMRSPLLRVGGEGSVSLPAENVDYTMTLLLASTLEGQGGKSLAETKGLKIPLKIKGTFTELSEDFVGTVRRGMQDAIKENLKAATDEKIAAEKAKLKAKLDSEKTAQENKLKQKAEKEKERLKKKASDALKKLF